PALASRMFRLRSAAATRAKATRVGMSSGLVTHSPARKRFAAHTELAMPRATYSPARSLGRGRAISGGTRDMLRPDRVHAVGPVPLALPACGNCLEIVDRLTDQGCEVLLVGLADPALKCSLEGGDSCLRGQRRSWLADTSLTQGQRD